MKKKFSIKARLASFKNAWRGVTVFVRQEHNAWIHCAMTVLVIIAGLLFHISTVEWIAVIFAIGLVLTAEAINSAIERLSDVVQSENGGIRLDSMFIDEGFGSLDEESLRQAIRTLLDLSENNRLVGIISHVAELKERIDKQIVVTKEKTGGSIVEIVV